MRPWADTKSFAFSRGDNWKNYLSCVLNWNFGFKCSSFSLSTTNFCMKVNSQENKNRLTLIISIVYIFNILFHTTMELIVFSKDFIMFINSVAVVIRRLVYLPIISIRNQKVNFAHNLIYQKNFSIFLSKSLTENSCSTTRPRIMILTLC